MLTYSIERYKRISGTEEQLLMDFSAFTMKHLDGDLSSMTKHESYIGNSKKEVFTFEDGAVFTIETLFYHKRSEVSWTNSESAEIKSFTKEDK